jgi:hypothetical protein
VSTARFPPVSPYPRPEAGQSRGDMDREVAEGRFNHHDRTQTCRRNRNRWCSEYALTHLTSKLSVSTVPHPREEKVNAMVFGNRQAHGSISVTHDATESDILKSTMSFTYNVRCMPHIYFICEVMCIHDSSMWLSSVMLFQELGITQYKMQGRSPGTESRRTLVAGDKMISCHATQNTLRQVVEVKKIISISCYGIKHGQVRDNSIHGIDSGVLGTSAVFIRCTVEISGYSMYPKGCTKRSARIFQSARAMED